MPSMWREKMVETAAEANEELMDKYLEEGDLSIDDIKQGLRIRTIGNEIVPMLCGSAFKNKGVQAMLDAVLDYLPSPVDIQAINGEKENGEPGERHASDEEPFAGLAFKIATDPYVGQLIFFRVYSGVVSSGDTIYNPIKGRKERIGRLLQMHANQREEIKEVRAGDIAAAVGLKEAVTGDTLCDPSYDYHAGAHDFSRAGNPRCSGAKTKLDQEKMGIALNRLAQEDPSFRVRTDEESGQTIISGMGELHLEIIVDRMKREFGVEANVGARKWLIAKPSKNWWRSKASSSSNPAGVGNMVMSGSRWSRMRQVKVLSLLTPSRVELSARIYPGGGKRSARDAPQWRIGWLPGSGRQSDAF